MNDTTVSRLGLTGDLPSGTVVLEASAGTGKTYAIAALVTRAVAEGRCTLPELLVVTFTRAATAELRDRIRRRLVEAADHLAVAVAALQAGRSRPSSEDDVLTHLAAADLDELGVRHARLVDAIADFDAATISTIHGFTQQVLRTVGLSAEVRRDVQLLEDPTALIDEVVDDVRVRRYLEHVQDPDDAASFEAPTRTVLHAIASAVITRSDAVVVPDPDDDLPLAAELGAAARELRSEADLRKRRAGVLGYDDLLLALRDALEHEDRGDQAVEVLRDRYRWALVDEFQDTDPVQWDILHRAFRDPDDPQRALVLIGDPKQAIYAFRGADVRAYLEATRASDVRHTLGTNWRSDAPLLAALDRLFDGTTFGHADIVFRRVVAAPRHAGSALHDDGDPSPLQLRVVGEVPGGKSAGAVRQHVADDVAATVVAHLRDVRLGPERRRLQPRQVAVLVRTNAEATQVQRALRNVAVPAVVNGVGSVLATDAADEWRWLLESLERPADPARARRVAVSSWFGWDAARLLAATDDDWDELHARLHAWAGILRDHGVATLLRVVLTRLGTARRLLGQEGGERHLTDLRHIGELLHTAELEDERGVTALLSWLLARCAEATDTGTPSDEQARRLESDAEAVQILTIHRSKGLEYEVVLCPYLWGGGQQVSAPLTVHAPGYDRRLIDVGPSDRDGFDAHQDLAKAEAAGEALRLLYVAVTRAKHRAVVWWARIGGCERSALARVLFGRDEDGQVTLAEKVALPNADEDLAMLEAAFADDLTSVTEVPAQRDDTAWAGEPHEPRQLAVRGFDRTLDLAWRRTSYSGITALAERMRRRSLVDSEPSDGVKDDEPDAPDAAGGLGDVHGDGADGTDALDDGEVARLRAYALPMGELRGGAEVGTLVHAVLEHTDFASEDLDAALDVAIAREVRRHQLDLDDDLLKGGLEAALTTPLGPLAGEVPDTDGAMRPRRLRDIGRNDRLDELGFELPLAGGANGGPDGAHVELAHLAALLDRHLPADDPIGRLGYADRLHQPGYHLDLRGYLSGSIDLVLRVPAPAGGPGGDATRYLVADHKTNRLAWPDAPTAHDYRPSALASAMVHHDYPLQALLYQVALHRYLRWRQPGYDPAVHLGGVLYLFLRGMAGPDTPWVGDHPCGVFSWNPPTALITDLSELLDGVEVPA